MKKPIYYKALFIGALMACFLVSCHKETWVDVQINEINSAANSANPFPIATTESKTVLGTGFDLTAFYSNSTYRCDIKKIQFSKPIDKIPVLGLDDSHLQAYPGAIIELKSLYGQGIYKPVEQFTREGLTLKSTIAGTLPRKIESINDTKVKFAVADMSGSLRNKNSFQSSDTAVAAYQARQGLLELGIPPLWAKPSVRLLPNANPDGEFADKLLFLSFSQAHYSVEVVEPPTNASDFFATNTPLDMSKFKEIATPDNPLGYISRVTYGAKVLVSMACLDRNSPSHPIFVNRLNQLMQGGTLKIDDAAKEMFKNCHFTILHTVASKKNRLYSYSGMGIEFLNTVQNFLKDIEVSTVPIEYQVRYLSNQGLFSAQISTDYTEHNCQLRPTAVYINSIGFTFSSAPPPSVPGVVTPIVRRNPDALYIIFNAKGKELERGEISYGVLLSRGRSWYSSFKMPNFEEPVFVGVLSTAGYLGDITFNAQDYMKITPYNSALFPSTITKTESSSSSRLTITLGLSWY